MPLDSNLFSDLEKMVRWNVAATTSLSWGHEDKFDLTTPSSAWPAVTRTWEHSPTSDRIVEDINRVAVDFSKLRHGRRLHKHIRSRLRSKNNSKKHTVDDKEGLHPVSKRMIIDLCDW